MLLVWDWDKKSGCITGCSGDIGLVGRVQRLLDYKVRGSYTCSRLGIVSEVKVLGRAGRYRGVKDKGKSISNSVLLRFHYKLNFFIVYSWCLISYKVHLYSSFASIIYS